MQRKLQKEFREFMIWAENHSCLITLYSSVQIGTGRKRHDFIDRHSQLFFETANAVRIRHLEENGGFAERMRKLRKQNQIIGKPASVSRWQTFLQKKLA